MIILVGEGRLGNQLFQYAYLANRYPGKIIWCMGCEGLKQHVLTGPVRYFPRTARWWRLLSKALVCLARLHVIRLLAETGQECGRYVINLQWGLVPWVVVVAGSYFQHASILPSAAPVSPSMRCLEAAQRWLAEKRVEQGIARGREFVFVHVRRGDYLRWPSREAPAVLPLEWYRRAMDWIRTEVKDPVFVVLGDDLPYIFEFFTESQDLIISDADEGVDMAIMSKCSHGILSASTFAWWGAFLSRESGGYKLPHEKRYIAPLFWAGHRSGAWFPGDFYTSWLTYM
ncbi:alpha-1,2-fucosyltransferase [Castellaniella sp.]|uniref:alpha-1,2-fucosyltransferase n=1 Tax=Castellaniella sp. TaxID=1955812 RepID=UPI0039C8A3C0